MNRVTRTYSFFWISIGFSLKPLHMNCIVFLIWRFGKYQTFKVCTLWSYSNGCSTVSFPFEDLFCLTCCVCCACLSVTCGSSRNLHCQHPPVASSGRRSLCAWARPAPAAPRWWGTSWDSGKTSKVGRERSLRKTPLLCSLSASSQFSSSFRAFVAMLKHIFWQTWWRSKQWKKSWAALGFLYICQWSICLHCCVEFRGTVWLLH